MQKRNKFSMIFKIKYIGFAFIISLILVSCKKSQSLQEYYVDSQSSSNFIAIDIPSSFLSLKNDDATKEVKATLNSVKKINFLGFQKSEENKVEYAEEQLKVKKILKNSKYKELIRFDNENKSMQVTYLGEDNAIDEVLFFGSDTDLGFALIRILGNKMNPSKMMALAAEINVNDKNVAIEQITSFLGSIK
jgi:hypothetical protein